VSDIDDLLEAALYKEVDSRNYYSDGQKLTGDLGAIQLMKELAEAEDKHVEWIRNLKEKGVQSGRYYPQKIRDLMLSEHLTGGDTLEGAGLQDTLIYAIKRERQSLEFYANMMGIMRDRAAKALCRRLANAELGHKYLLEKMYDNLFLAEN
jgi:rubrerythrin